VANLKRADEPLAEVEALLKTLGEAWQAVSPGKSGENDDIQTAKLPPDWGALPMRETKPGYSAHGWSA
jgi:hypothetical protein